MFPLRAYHNNQWPFQEPKLEVLTIYKAYLLGLCKGISPQFIWPKIWYSTLTHITCRVQSQMSHLRYCGKPNNQNNHLGDGQYYPSIYYPSMVIVRPLLGKVYCWVYHIGQYCLFCIPSPFMAEKTSLANIFPKFSPLSDGDNPFVLICVDGTLNPCKRGVRCILSPD